jgi:hypothetical protein
LLAAGLESSTRSNCEAVDDRADDWCGGAFPSLFTGVAGALGTGLALWDTTVGVGASVVAGTAIAAGLIGVGLDNALAEAFLTPLGLLVEGGVLPAQAATAIAAIVEGFTTAANIGIAGVGTGIAWKAALDAALANAIAPAGADIINALLADFPNMDFPAAIAAAIGGLAAMGETALTWWDATVTLGASVVAGMAIMAATSAMAVNTAVAGAFVQSIEVLAGTGLLRTPVAAALAALVGSVSSAANVGMLGLGAAVAWKAALDAALAHATATTGVGLIDGIAGMFPNVPEYPVIDVDALHAVLEANFPDFPLLPPLNFADLEPTKFTAVLKSTFPNIPEVDLTALLAALIPNVDFPDCNFADVRDLDASAQLSSTAPKNEVSISSQDEEPELTADSNVVPQPAKQVLAEEPALTEPPSAPRHMLPGEPDEAALVRTASLTPPKHALNDSSKDDLDGVPEPDVKKSNIRSPEAGASESLQSSDSSPQGTVATSQPGSDNSSHKQANGASDRGSNGKQGSNE